MTNLAIDDRWRDVATSRYHVLHYEISSSLTQATCIIKMVFKERNSISPNTCWSAMFYHNYACDSVDLHGC